MIKYGKIINQETKQCEVGTGTNAKFYQSIGMELMEVEQAYDGSYYLLGYAPTQSIEELDAIASENRRTQYTALIDPLHARRQRKQVLGSWTDEDEAEYTTQIAELSQQIEEEFPPQETEESEEV